MLRSKGGFAMGIYISDEVGEYNIKERGKGKK